jgi:hypothetical protein
MLIKNLDRQKVFIYLLYQNELLVVDVTYIHALF